MPRGDHLRRQREKRKRIAERRTERRGEDNARKPEAEKQRERWYPGKRAKEAMTKKLKVFGINISKKLTAKLISTGLVFLAVWLSKEWGLDPAATITLVAGIVANFTGYVIKQGAIDKAIEEARGKAVLAEIQEEKVPRAIPVPQPVQLPPRRDADAETEIYEARPQ